MKVALFGGTGFVGSYIVREHVRKGFIPKILVPPKRTTFIFKCI